MTDAKSARRESGAGSRPAIEILVDEATVVDLIKARLGSARRLFPLGQADVGEHRGDAGRNA
jgi:hypothetical protein